MSKTETFNDDGANVHNGDRAVIAPIAAREVERIVAGQAVLDLASAVKELVDNALDSGARSINIRLFNQGIDIIEVSDDGCGIPVISRPLISMKHATSKLRSFDELYQGNTATSVEGRVIRPKTQLGFRGEALFCLANLSQNLVVATRTSTDDLGQKLEFGRDGHLDPKSVTDIPRKVGTTVAVVKLFDALPVRRADFIKRIKFQRAKLVRMMQGYAILCLGVRFNLIDVSGPVATPQCKSEVKMSTSDSSTTVEQSISSVLGSKFLSGMCRISVDLSKVVLAGRGVESGLPTDGSKNDLWRIDGMVSMAPIMASDSKIARELQFFSINGRPVELPKLSRVIGDTWRAFDSTAPGSGNSAIKKRPACVLCVFLPNNMYDVNIAPDKRDVLFTDENTICGLLRNELQRLWSSQCHGTFTANEVESLSNKKRAFVEVQTDCNVESNGGHSEPHVSDKRRAIGKMQRRNAIVCGIEFRGIAPPNESPHSATNAASVKMQTDGNTIWTPLERSSHNAVVSSNKSNAKSSFDAPYDSPLPRVCSGRTAQLTTPSLMHETIQDRQLWEQTKLRFNTGESDRAEDEMRKISLTKVCQQSLANNNVRKMENSESQFFQNDCHISPAEAIKTTSILVVNEPKKLKTCDFPFKKSSYNSLKQFEFAPNAGKTSPIKGNEYKEAESASPGVNSTLHNKETVAKLPKRVDSTLSSIGKVETYAPLRCLENEANDDEEICLLEGHRPRPVAHTQHELLGDVEKVVASTPPGTQPTRTSTVLCQQQTPERKVNGGTLPRDLECNHDLTAVAPKPVVWNSFSGTNQVVRASQAARIKMRANRSYLLQCRSRIKETERQCNQDVSVLIADKTIVHNDSPVTDIENVSTMMDAKTVSLSKDAFFKMTVVGQFNLGFILAMCENNHLWIFDQHACDEKYNFEKICAQTVLHEQKLIAPLPLELSPSEENCVLENLSVFEQNGFRFDYDEKKPLRHRLSLTALPHSGSGGNGQKAVQFGVEDVGALCSILGADGASSSSGYIAGSGTGASGNGSMGNNAVRRYAGGGGELVRLPRAIAMFASRACRKSIMIGEALSHCQMENIVKRMSEVDGPWSCPHGRPTMRHVKNLLTSMLTEEQVAAQRVAGPSLAVLSQCDGNSESNISEEAEC